MGTDTFWFLDSKNLPNDNTFSTQIVATSYSQDISTTKQVRAPVDSHFSITPLALLSVPHRFNIFLTERL
jgi:hypothetical protein